LVPRHPTTVHPSACLLRCLDFANLFHLHNVSIYVFIGEWWLSYLHTDSSSSLGQRHDSLPTSTNAYRAGRGAARKWVRQG
jgi:hypothetical protein